MRLSMKDLAKMVLACAAASLCITPVHRAIELNGGRRWDVLLVVDAIVIPLVWSLFTFVFVRHGPRRTALVEGFLLGAVAVPVAFLAWAFAAYTWPRVRSHGLGSIHGEDLVVAPVMLGLAGLAGFLGLRTVRRVRGLWNRRHGVS